LFFQDQRTDFIQPSVSWEIICNVFRDLASEIKELRSVDGLYGGERIIWVFGVFGDRR
jgi:hypothetical protein